MANRDLENSVLTRKQIPALDITTHTGHFSSHEVRTQNFAENKRRNGNKIHGVFGITLLSLPRRYGTCRVVAEDTGVNRHFYDIRRLSELRGILLEVCDGLDIPESELVNPAILKKWAAGDGHATKTQMVAAYKDRYSIVLVDDNAADTCRPFYYYIRRHRL